MIHTGTPFSSVINGSVVFECSRRCHSLSCPCRLLGAEGFGKNLLLGLSEVWTLKASLTPTKTQTKTRGNSGNGKGHAGLALIEDFHLSMLAHSLSVLVLIRAYLSEHPVTHRESFHSCTCRGRTNGIHGKIAKILFAEHALHLLYRLSAKHLLCDSCLVAPPSLHVTPDSP
jgi:hypothetical protein